MDPLTPQASKISVTSEPSREDVFLLEERLYEFNVERTGLDDGEYLAVFLRDEQGSLQAGLFGDTWGRCCKIRDLWVRADLRGRGLGTELLEAAEGEARRRGCVQIVLSSHSFQAPEFYRKMGYETYAVLEDYPVGHSEIYLRKRLVQEIRSGSSGV